MANATDFKVKRGLVVSTTATILSTVNATSTTTGALIVAGGVGIGGDTWHAGQVFVTARESTDGSIKFQTNIISTGTYTNAPVSGISFSNQYQPGANAGMGGISVGKLNTTSGDFSSYLSLHTRNNGSSVAERLRIDNTGSVIILSTSSSASTTTGALQVIGGAGIGGNLYVGGTIVGNLTGIASTASVAITATNISSGATGSIPYQTAAGLTSFISIGTLGQVLQSNGTTATWVSTSSLVAGTAFTATTILGGTAGQLVYQSAPGVTAFAGPGTAGQVLVSAGTSAPVYTNTGSIYVGNSARVDTVAQTANASYYPTFVDANNPTAASEIVYTTSSFIINPSSGNIRVASSTEYVAKAKLQLNYGDDSVGTNAYAQLALGYSGGGYNHLVQTYHNATLNDGNAIVFYLNTGTVAATSNAVGVGNTSSYFMGYQTHRWSTSGIERMRLDANGNLGVGLTAPLSKLHVSGDARITGITTVSNTTAVSSTSTGALQVWFSSKPCYS